MDCLDWKRWGVVLALLPAVACDTGPIDRSQFTENLCDASGLHALVAIEPDEPVDASVVRTAQQLDLEAPNSGELDAFGTLCSGARDREACRRRVLEETFESEFVSDESESPTYLSLVFTRGDEVGGAWRMPQLLDFLGEIDSPGDAMLLATLAGHAPVCMGGDDVGERDGGYVVFTQSGRGCGSFFALGDENRLRHNVVRVDPDGELDVIESTVVEGDDPACGSGG